MAAPGSNLFAALDDSDEEETPRQESVQKKGAPGAGKEDTRRKARVERGTPGSRGSQGGTDKRGKREFDRRSGSGRDDRVKKGGAGGHNWGKDRDSADKAARAGSATAAAEAAEPTADGGPADDYQAEPEEPEAPTQSFEEYLKAKQQSSGAGFEELKTRQLSKAEKPDGKAISGKKTDDTSFIHMTHLGVKEKRNRQKKLKEKRPDLLTGMKVDQPSMGGDDGGRGRGRGRGRGGGRFDDGGRGRGRGGGRFEDGGRGRGRGGGRGDAGARGRGRGSGRGGRGGRGGTPNFASAEAFPSLG